MAVLGALSRYGDQPESFLPFVYGIAAHKVADHYRRAGRDRSDPAADVPDGIDVGASPEQQIMAADLRSRLGMLLSTLPPRQREILRAAPDRGAVGAGDGDRGRADPDGGAGHPAPRAGEAAGRADAGRVGLDALRA